MGMGGRVVVRALQAAGTWHCKKELTGLPVYNSVVVASHGLMVAHTA